MKKQVENGQRLLHSQGRLFLVGLAILLLVGLLPRWVNAESAAASFTSPLPKPTHEANALKDLLRTIIDRDALTAEVLGISVDELKAARESGVRLDELITQLGLDEATVHQELQTAFTEAVQQAVTDGLLTQDQANIILTPPAPGGGERHHDHDPNQAGGDRGPGGPPNAHETPAPTSATPVATSPTASAATSGTPSTATPAAPAHRPHGERGDPNAQGDHPTSPTAAANASASTSADSSQTSNGEASGSHNRPTDNRHSGR